MNQVSSGPPPLAQGRAVTWQDVSLAFVREMVAMTIVVGGIVVALQLAKADPKSLEGALGTLLGTGFVAMLGRSRPPGSTPAHGTFLGLLILVGAALRRLVI